MTEKLRWNMSDARCIAAYIEAAEISDSYGQVAERLSGRISPQQLDSPKLTPSTFIGAMRRGTLSDAIRRHLRTDPKRAEIVIAKFKGGRRTTVKPSMVKAVRAARQTATRISAPPRPQRRPPPKEEAPKRLRPPDPEAAAQAAAIEAYLNPLRKSDLQKGYPIFKKG